MTETTDAAALEWRSPKYNLVGTIDMEINHPVHGWIAFTADPNDLEPIGAMLYAAALESNNVAPADPPSHERLKTEILAATQQRLDDFARTRNYDGIMSAATYGTSTIEQFAAEGQRAVELRDQTWAMLYQMLAEVQAGTRPMPSGFTDIEGELPALAWS